MGAYSYESLTRRALLGSAPILVTHPLHSYYLRRTTIDHDRTVVILVKAERDRWRLSMNLYHVQQAPSYLGAEMRTLRDENILQSHLERPIVSGLF
jgi:hypothetical protein